MARDTLQGLEDQLDDSPVTAEDLDTSEEDDGQLTDDELMETAAKRTAFDDKFDELESGDEEDDTDEGADTDVDSSDDEDDKSIKDQVDEGDVEKTGKTEDGKDLYTVKVDGEEVEVTLDDLQKAYSSKSHSARIAQEAQQVRKQTEALVQQLHSDPIGTLKQLEQHGVIDKETLNNELQNYFLEQYQLENMSPEEKEKYELQKRVQQYEEQERIQKEQEQQQYVEQLQEQIQTEIIDTLETSSLPKSDYTVSRMAHYLRQGYDQGVDLKPKDVIKYVEKDYQRDLQAMFSKSDPEKLTEMLGEDALKNLRKADADKMKKKTGQDEPRNSKVGKGGEEARKSKEKKGPINSFSDVMGRPEFED